MCQPRFFISARFQLKDICRERTPSKSRALPSTWRFDGAFPAKTGEKRRRTGHVHVPSSFTFRSGFPLQALIVQRETLVGDHGGFGVGLLDVGADRNLVVLHDGPFDLLGYGIQDL